MASLPPYLFSSLLDGVNGGDGALGAVEDAVGALVVVVADLGGGASSTRGDVPGPADRERDGTPGGRCWCRGDGRCPRPDHGDDADRQGESNPAVTARRRSCRPTHTGSSRRQRDCRFQPRERRPTAQPTGVDASSTVIVLSLTWSGLL